MNGVVVEKIEFLSENDKEALVSITDGNYSCLTFCQPCNYSLGDFITVPIHSFDTLDIILETTSCEFYLKRKNSNFGYEAVAKVFNVEDRILKIGSILIELDIDRVEFGFRIE